MIMHDLLVSIEDQLIGNLMDSVHVLPVIFLYFRSKILERDKGLMIWLSYRTPCTPGIMNIFQRRIHPSGQCQQGVIPEQVSVTVRKNLSQPISNLVKVIHFFSLDSSAIPAFRSVMVPATMLYYLHYVTGCSYKSHDKDNTQKPVHFTLIITRRACIRLPVLKNWSGFLEADTIH